MLAVDFSPRWGPQSKAHRVAMLQAVSRQSPGETVFCGRHVHPLEASRRDPFPDPIPWAEAHGYHRRSLRDHAGGLDHGPLLGKLRIQLLTSFVPMGRGLSVAQDGDSLSRRDISS